MSVNLSLIRNIDPSFTDTNGDKIDMVIIGQNDNKQNVICAKIPRVCDNDYEFIYALKQAFLTLESALIVRENTTKLNDKMNISKDLEELLKNSRAMCDFANSTFFAITGDMLRFSIDKKENKVYFVKDRKIESLYMLEGSIISCLPELFMQYNMEKLSKDINFYGRYLKSNETHEIIEDKKKKLAKYRQVYRALSGEAGKYFS